MPSQIEKLEAHIDRLLDVFLGLKEKYALLWPMVYNDEIIKTQYSKKGRCFFILRDVLFLDCVGDISKLCFDSDKRTPSLKKIRNALVDEHVRLRLEKLYTVWKISVADKDLSHDELVGIAEFERKESVKLKIEFEEKCARFEGMFDAISNDSILEAFRAIRDKVHAHSELSYVEGKYKPVRVEDYGVKWIDLKNNIEIIQELVDLANQVVRRSGFEWDSQATYLKNAGNFWAE